VINLAEIELYTGSNSNYVKIPNSALTCTMSTTGYGLTVDKCFDGITNSDSNMCHTDGTPNFGEYLTCIVAGGYSVSMVKVYNRYSSYTHELQRINNANLIYSRYSDGTSVLHQSSFGDTASALYTFTWTDPTNTNTNTSTNPITNTKSNTSTNY